MPSASPVTSVAVSLRMNGYALSVGPDAAERFLVDEIIAGRAELAVITEWLERHLAAR